MKSRFEWKDAYNLGDEKIDPQHQQLLLIAKQFELSTSKEEAQLALMAVYRYTREHFSDEEAYMKNVAYPDYNNHRNIHERLITKFNNFVENFDNSTVHKQKIIDFFAEWIIIHIATEDKKIAEFIRQ